MSNERIIDEEGSTRWYRDGRLHRDGDLPAFEGIRGVECWYKDGRLHRDNNLPAVVYKGRPQEYHFEGQQYVYRVSNGVKATYNMSELLHSINDMPANEYPDGTKEWYQDGRLHRDGDLPAIEWANGNKSWLKDGLLHRDGGKPAIERVNEDNEWYQHGIKLIHP